MRHDFDDSYVEGDQDTTPVSRQRLLDLVIFEYRSLAIRRLGVTAEWRVLEWTEAAACTGRAEATAAMCSRCPVVAECLAAAIASDDRAEWRGGLNRTDRERLWSGLDRTFREVRDFELMRLDVPQITDRDHLVVRKPPHQVDFAKNGGRS